MSHKTPFTLQLEQLSGDILAVEKVMQENLESDVALIAKMRDDHLTGGKCVRATVALLSARLCGLDEKTGLTVAASIEFIHTATLLHDDVVDDATMRRHQLSAKYVYGNAAAVLAGDFLYSRASQMLANLGNAALLQRIADTTNKLAEGEILQLINRNKPSVDEAVYFSIVRRKTANLFATAACAPAILMAKSDDAAALAAYGAHLGIAFQLIDDCLDYVGNDDETGKIIGTDFSEGKVTLPIILMLERVSKTQKHALIAAWQAADDSVFEQMCSLIQQSGALEEVKKRATEEVNAAICALSAYSHSPTGQQMIALAHHSVTRQA